MPIGDKESFRGLLQGMIASGVRTDISNLKVEGDQVTYEWELMPNGQQISPRWSAVFHQEDGEWKLVQLHASVGIPNEKLFGMEPSG